MMLLTNGMLACGSGDALVICNPLTGLIETELAGHDKSIETYIYLKMAA